jgi:hypothetical protein
VQGHSQQLQMEVMTPSDNPFKPMRLPGMGQQMRVHHLHQLQLQVTT